MGRWGRQGLGKDGDRLILDWKRVQLSPVRAPSSDLDREMLSGFSSPPTAGPAGGGPAWVSGVLQAGSLLATSRPAMGRFQPHAAQWARGIVRSLPLGSQGHHF